MKLLTPKDDVRGRKVQLVAAFLDLPLQTVPFTVGKDDKDPAFLAKSPLGRLPLLESEVGGVCLFESNAICRFLARLRADKCLYGETLAEQGQVDMWLDFSTLEVEIPMCCLVQGGKVAERAQSDLAQALNAVDAHLKTRTFMVGENITIADLCLVAVLSYGFRSGKVDAAALLEKRPYLKRFYETVVNQKSFKKIFGEAKAAPQAAAKKETPKAAAKPAQSAGDDEEPAKKPAVKCELDLLPEPTMDLNEWKRVYSNTKDLYGTAMKWFWEHLDAAGYSLWYMKYQKLEGECTVAFVTSNQLGGFLQRIDPAFRKYSFGVVDVMGENGCFDIEGVWLFRGQDVPSLMKDHPSYEYHTWQKLDVASAKDKQLVADFWCACDDIQGRPIADSKVWK
ncbi:putative elongation factor 1-gamma [Toxoplasma gondii TgCatPRC2]|uniref:Elongation factor 1-gamma, putative n=15 Tax=Toxoplasma gondii TaxID=5811 RepID=B9Q2T3_TOXGV|nr:elongation factor 1-gamma, putative [Toxoplasma gondii ME49]EPR56949.1 putative elongation factor 1-gamma [Toxoplasma gondii GT1]ESS28422.1 putative elongation factor 1-gamma [Toxoplasma gondii VEG]KAF4638113.1 putative elongation factor 1-gamma [Toxoplasma gondii]KFG28792.1 putative elongation factor 1-gamma [Toxoplasma gondii p89]KFG34628.1 putative elongation factor 1-gamma [Toxoplasma gondii FOU]KFG47916.1 putative elongation factor 1-gamma [Toxoplasma gondii GAB2-2007-GAL-DOM2]KFG570|eukprot:XP_002371737.1 elongation factor 1-gamma, putative [Toxoplasma gondii ME49]